MKLLLICSAATTLMSGAVFAETTVIRPDRPEMMQHRSVDADKKVIVHDRDGCVSKTVKKTNGMGDTVIRHKSDC